MSFHALGLGIDEEPDRGGANEDAASMDVSAITTPYAAPPARKRKGMMNDNNIEEQAIDGIEVDTVQANGSTRMHKMIRLNLKSWTMKQIKFLLIPMTG